MGAGTRLPLFATRGGGGKGTAGRVVNLGLWQGQAPRSPPPCFQGMGEEFLPLGRQGLPEDGQRPSPALSYCSLPLATSSQGCARGRRSIVRPRVIPFTYKHLLRAYCMPRFSSPQGAATKTLPKCKITTGSSGPQENGRDQNSSWPGHKGGWRLSSSGKSEGPLQSLKHHPRPSLCTTGGEGGREGQGHLLPLTLCYRPEQPPAPPDCPSYLMGSSSRIRASLSPVFGAAPGLKNKGQSPPVHALFHLIRAGAPPQMLLASAGLTVCCFTLLPAWNAHSLSICLTRTPSHHLPGEPTLSPPRLLMVDGMDKASYHPDGNSSSALGLALVPVCRTGGRTAPAIKYGTVCGWCEWHRTRPLFSLFHPLHSGLKAPCRQGVWLLIQRSQPLSQISAQSKCFLHVERSPISLLKKSSQ